MQGDKGPEETYDVYEDIPNASNILDQSLGCEEQTVGEGLQSQFDAHRHHKDVFCNLEEGAKKSLLAFL